MTNLDVMSKHDATPRCHGMVSRRVTSRHDVTTWCHAVTSHCGNAIMSMYTRHPVKEAKNYVFQDGDLDLWPMTLTSELVRDMVKVNPSTKFWVRMFNGSVARALTDRHTDTQTGPILYPRPLMREGIKISLIKSKSSPSPDLNLHIIAL